MSGVWKTYSQMTGLEKAANDYWNPGTGGTGGLTYIEYAIWEDSSPADGAPWYLWEFLVVAMRMYSHPAGDPVDHVGYWGVPIVFGGAGDVRGRVYEDSTVVGLDDTVDVPGTDDDFYALLWDFWWRALPADPQAVNLGSSYNITRPEAFIEEAGLSFGRMRRLSRDDFNDATEVCFRAYVD